MRSTRIFLLLLTIALAASPGAGPVAAQPTAKTKAHSATAATTAPQARVEFLRDIAPIIDRSGCSTAGCHGKFGGRGGFQISLLTLSPEDDYVPLVFGSRGRKVNFAAPEQSLLLLKATMTVPHVGGPRFAVGSPQYNTILRWIKEGAPFAATDPRLVSLKVTPPKVELTKVGDARALHVIATYTDGSVRDVTSKCVYQSTNPAVMDVSQDGVVTGSRWGGGAILARYLGTIAPSFISLPQVRKGPFPVTPANNIIDTMVIDNLKALNCIPSKLSDDPEFLRRVSLDVLGRLPSPDEIADFSANTDPDKRTKLIDSYIDRPEAADFRTLRLCDLLRVNPRKFGNGTLGDRSATLFYNWILESVTQNKPYDQFVHELIAARGSTYQYGPANFYRVEREPNDRMENLGQAFLGVRMMCARCHKHPFDRWTTDDYWNFAAFFGKVGARGGKLNDEQIIDYNAGGQVTNQSVNGRNRGKIAPCTYLGDKDPAPQTPDMVMSLADWITNPSNPFFARATVNRLWSFYFGRGIVQPVDDMRTTTPESVPGLLDALAKDFVDHHYDVKYLTRLILNSRAYQLSAIPNSSNSLDDRYFSHYFPKPMPAQALLDVLNQATGTQEKFGPFMERTRAVQSPIPQYSQFLTSFGESHREFLADIDPKLEPNLVQTLMMINSPYIESKIRGGNTVNNTLSRYDSDADVVKGLFLRTFCRQPSPTELAKSVALLEQSKDRREGAQDLLWALVTSREFFFNH